jgi:hypothetical protein
VTTARTRSIVTLAAVVLLAACSAPDLTPDEGDGVPGTAPADTEAEDDPLAGDPFADVPGDPDDPAPDPDDPGSPEDRPLAPPTACAGDDLAAMDEVIAGQLAAFAADDWEAALGFASRDFREDVDPEAFAILIEEGFPVAADATEHRSSACVTRGSGTAEVRVEVTSVGGDRADLVYLLVDEDGWRIAGAVPLDGAEPDGSDTTTV